MRTTRESDSSYITTRRMCERPGMKAQLPCCAGAGILTVSGGLTQNPDTTSIPNALKSWKKHELYSSNPRSRKSPRLKQGKPAAK